MPAIMPPINPNIIAALGQYFGGMQNRTIRTPPFVRPGSTAQRGEVLGRPSMPTPGMPQTMPQPVGGPAPTAPGVAPSPRSLGDELANIPKQPTLIPTPRAATPVAAAPATPPPNYQLDPGELPEGFSEIKDASDGSRRLVDADGNEYVYNASGRQISGPPPPAAAAPSAVPSAAPSAEPPEEDTSRTATQRGIKSTVANELGGRTDEDTDGTKYVYDKNNKLVKTIAPPGGSPVTGTQPGGGAQAPASMPQKKGGIWDRLTDPSLAGIALAAGQQMTRARYPGESGIGNAVNAVTAGYNTLAQQRQMQVAREQAQREWEAKQAKARQEAKESEAKIQDYGSQAEERRATAANQKRQRELEAARDKQSIENKNVDQMMEMGRQNIDKDRNAQLAADAAARLKQAEADSKRAQAQLDLAQKTYEESVRQHQSQAKQNAAQIAVSQGQLAVQQTNSAHQAARDAAFKPYQDRALGMIMEEHKAAVYAAQQRGQKLPPLDLQDAYKRALPMAQQMYDDDQKVVRTGGTTAAPAQAPAAAPQGESKFLRDPKTGKIITRGP